MNSSFSFTLSHCRIPSGFHIKCMVVINYYTYTDTNHHQVRNQSICEMFSLVDIFPSDYIHPLPIWHTQLKHTPNRMNDVHEINSTPHKSHTSGRHSQLELEPSTYECSFYCRNLSLYQSIFVQLFYVHTKSLLLTFHFRGQSLTNRIFHSSGADSKFISIIPQLVKRNLAQSEVQTLQ